MSLAFPRIKLPDGRTVEAPSPEWREQCLRWRWLIDSWEGGEAYRQADYGSDARGMPIRNLIRHKREYPQDSSSYPATSGRPVGTDQAAQATDDDYELRRARTPVPTQLRDAIEFYLSKIYNREVQRPGELGGAGDGDGNPPELIAWWRDVDGRGATIDQWMADSAAPILLALGQLDLLFDHPALPPGVEIRTQADQARYGLDRCLVSIIMPENIPWWRADRFGRYLELIVRECDDDGREQWRYWNEEFWQLYDGSGKPVGSPAPHGHGCVPIVRIFDRQRPRSRMVGLPRWEAIAEIQREYYNRDSELILSDTTQAHPLLQGPEDFIQADGTLPVGPSWLLPKKKNAANGAATYEGFDVVDFPKGGAESIRLNKADLADASDRVAGLTKPAGSRGGTGSTVAQSGISKRLDQDRGNELLGKVANVLEAAEQKIAEMALTVLQGKPVMPETAARIVIRYPNEFQLMSADELVDTSIKFQAFATAAGLLPDIEGEMLGKLLRLMLPGLNDDQYAAFDREIAIRMQAAARQRQELAEAGSTTTVAATAGTDGATGDVGNPIDLEMIENSVNAQAGNQAG